MTEGWPGTSRSTSKFKTEKRLDWTPLKNRRGRGSATAREGRCSQVRAAAAVVAGAATGLDRESRGEQGQSKGTVRPTEEERCSPIADQLFSRVTWVAAVGLGRPRFLSHAVLRALCLSLALYRSLDVEIDAAITGG